MAQERFHNYNRPLLSLEENFRMVGLATPGVYAGFDRFQIVGGNQLRILHDITGIKRTSLAQSEQGPFGMFTTRQGVVVYDDEQPVLTVDFAASQPRIDILIAVHSFIDSPGGSSAVYSIVKGVEAEFPTAPNLTNQLTQIKLGHFIVYPGSSHSTTVFVRDEPKILGGRNAFLKNGEELLSAPENDFNKVQRTGVYFVNNALNPPTGATSTWVLWVYKGLAAGIPRIIQLATDSTSGRTYARTSNTLVGNVVSVWNSWLNFTNADITGDISALQAAIGTRVYTEQNYITNGESITTSLDALDIQLNDISSIFDQLVIDVDNLETSIGNRQYTENNILVDGESITASLNKLDQGFGAPTSTVNLNNLIQPGVYHIGSFSNGPTSFPSSAEVIVNKSVTGSIFQIIISKSTALGDPFISLYQVRTRNTSGVWGSWSDGTLNPITPRGGGYNPKIRFHREVMTWNMQSLATEELHVPLSIVPYASYIGMMGWVSNNANTIKYPLPAGNLVNLTTIDTSGSDLRFSFTRNSVLANASHNAAGLVVLIFYSPTAM